MLEETDFFPLNEEVVETHIVYGLEEEEAPFKVTRDPDGTWVRMVTRLKNYSR